MFLITPIVLTSLVFFVFLLIFLFYIKIKKEFTKIEIKMFIKLKTNQYYLLQSLCFFVILISSLQFLILTHLTSFSIIDLKTNDFRYSYFGLIVIFTISSLIILYKDIEKYLKKTLDHWTGKLSVSTSIIVISIFSTSYSTNKIESLTGYSYANFNSYEHLKWFYSIQSVIVITLILAIILHAIIQLKSIFESTHTENKTIRGYIENKLALKKNKFLFSFLTLGATVLITLSTINIFDRLFVSQFVHLNFHEFKHKATNIPSSSKASFLLRNNINKCNILIANNEKGDWEFNALYCHISLEDSAKNETMPCRQCE